MKKTSYILRVLVSILAGGVMYAQNLNEVVRYATEQLNGTARYQALGGAFGALGGDLSAISNNPAGSTVFSFNEAGASIAIQTYASDAHYLNTLSTTENSSFDISQAGFILAFVNPNSKWDKVAFGVNTQLVNNFNKNLRFNGINKAHGVADYFRDITNFFSITNFNFDNNVDYEYQYQGENYGYDAQQAYLGLYTGLVGYDDTNNSYFVDDLVGNGINQIHELNTKGGQRLYSLNISGRYLKKLSLGINLNIYTIEFNQTKFTSDAYIDNNSFLRQVDFEQHLSTFGTGVSFQLGALYQASELLRLGFSYTSPSYYELNDEYTDGLYVGYNYELNGATERYTYPDVVNVVEPYNLKTPSVTQGSIALVFANRGLLSLDYGFKDYTTAKVSSEGSNYSYLNNDIKASLGKASFLRFGGETRFSDISLRAGYWYNQTPFQEATKFDDTSGFSFGAGIRFGNGSLDLTFSKSNQDYKQQLYSIGLTDAGNINQHSGQVSLTYSTRF